MSSFYSFYSAHPNFKWASFTNPVRKESVSRFKENPSKDRFLTENEQQCLLTACQVSHWERLYLLVLIALTTGARKGELLRLKWSAINFSHRTASLGLTKNGKPRLLPLSVPGMG
ncbi:site-specific integrase [Nitrosomonas communis]|uniref:site-specific integrase n=1 Tax=Nitrosomonas communis TaxID=44574 RepID=UPI003528D2FA